MVLRVYLDTNILVDHCWWKHFSKETGRQSRAASLLDKAFSENFDGYISYIGVMELSSHLRDWFLLQKVIRGGYSFQSFRREKHRYLLTPDEKSSVGKIVRYYASSPALNYIEVDKISQLFFVRVKNFVDNYIELMDALHLILAQAGDCEYFVTKDSELRSRFQRIISEKIVEMPSSLKPISVTKLLKLIK